MSISCRIFCWCVGTSKYASTSALILTPHGSYGTLHIPLSSSNIRSSPLRSVITVLCSNCFVCSRCSREFSCRQNMIKCTRESHVTIMWVLSHAICSASFSVTTRADIVVFIIWCSFLNHFDLVVTPDRSCNYLLVFKIWRISISSMYVELSCVNDKTDDYLSVIYRRGKWWKLRYSVST
jgi:hypothetical protein